MKEVLYVNDDALKGIEAQIYGFSQTAVTATVSSTGISTRTNRALLRTLFAPWSIGAGGEREGTAAKTASETKNHTSERQIGPEARAATVMAYLRQDNNLPRDAYAALNKARSSEGTSFIHLQEYFMPFRWSTEDMDAWRFAAMDSGYLLMEVKSNPVVRVGMSLAQMPLWARDGKIGANNHLATRIRNNKGAFLNVFGSIDKGSYIRPLFVTF